MNEVYARKAKNKEVTLTIDTDAHSTEQLGLMEFGVNVARRGWLEKDDLVNTRAVKDVRFKD